MALVKRAKGETNYCLPVVLKLGNKLIKRERYYETEGDLWKAYRQLKAINGVMKPLYPIVYS